VSAPRNVAAVSRVLREAGLPKAGRYTAWGYMGPGDVPQDGYLVSVDRDHNRYVRHVGSPICGAHVNYTGHRNDVQRGLRAAHAALVAAGYDATLRCVGEHDAHTVEVRWS
jgi:hypothetical protein